MNLEKLLRKKRRAIVENNIQQLATVCKNLGDYYHENQQYENALDAYSEEATFYERLGKDMEKARAHRMVGEMYMLLENFDDAMKHEKIYLETAVREKNKIEEQRAYATIGRVYLTKAQSLLQSKSIDSNKAINQAERKFLQSLLICKSLNDLPKHEVLDMTARLYLNLGVTAECKGEYSEAIKFFEKAMSICRHNDFWDLLHKCYIDAGLLYFNRLNDNTKALQLFHLAINTAERLSTDRTVRLCQTLLSKAEVLIKMADFQGAKQVLRRAYKLKTSDSSDAESIESHLRVVAAMCNAENSLITTDSVNYIERKRLYEKLGDGACKLKNFEAAISYYQKMLEAAENNGDTGNQLIPVYVSLYQTYRDMKNYTLALEYMWKEYDLCQNVPSEAYSTLLGIADTKCAANHQFFDTDNVYERAKNVAKNMGSKSKEKAVMLKQIALREKHEMDVQAEFMREALKSNSFVVSADSSNEDIEDGTETDSEEINTPDIGDEINLDDLSDSGSEDEENAPKSSETVDTNQPRTLRKRGCYAIKKNEKGESQLHRACISGNAAMVRRLIEQGHPINVRDNAGWLPLHEAANHGFTEIVELLLDNGANINDKGGTGCDGFTPLHDACGNGVLSVVELLLNRGANATLKNDLGDNPLKTLCKWRADRILNPQEQGYYEVIYARLVKQLEKAGVTVSHESPKKQQNKPSTSSSSSSSAKKSTPRKRILNDLSDDEENKLPDSEDFETIDNILQEEFPRPDSPQLNLNSESTSNSNSNSRTPSPTDYNVNYRDVMSDLRKGNFQNKIDAISHTFKPVEKTAKRSAILAEEEVSHDDWLDDDLGPSSKRRRYLNERSFSNDSNVLTNSKKNKMKLSGSSSNESNIVSSSNHIVLSDDPDEENANAFNVLMNSNQNQLSRRKKRRNSSNMSLHRISGEFNSLQQSSLTETGFYRQRANSPDSIFMSVSSTVASPLKLSPHKPLAVPTIQSCSVKVQVSDLYLNIPVNINNANDLTIEWLAEEAAKRYYGMKGVKPVLRLTTRDGAIFENSDPLSSAFAENSALSSTVLEWIMPPLTQRYMETCVQHKINADPFINAQIELIASTQALTITDQFLAPRLNRPLFQALHFQSNITKIDLTNSFIEDDGLKVLAQALPTITHLMHLNLSGNLITATGIKYIASIFDASTPTDCLTELNALILNFNPLQNQCLAALEKFCQNLKQLNTLHLASCELSDLQNFDLKFFSLVDIDFSYNAFTRIGLQKAVTKFNPCKLVKLKLSYCFEQSDRDCEGDSNRNWDEMTENSPIDGLIQVLNTGNCSNLEEIYLCGHNLNDINCWQIIQSIKRSKSLQTVSLRENPAITKITWKLLLENLSIRNLYLEGCKLLVNDLTEMDAEVLSGISQLCDNVIVSIDAVPSESSIFNNLKQFWCSFTQYAGKVFSRGRNILLTMKPASVSTDSWTYHS